MIGKTMSPDDIERIARGLMEKNPNNLVGKTKAGENVGTAIVTWISSEVQQICGFGGEAANALREIQTKFHEIVGAEGK